MEFSSPLSEKHYKSLACVPTVFFFFFYMFTVTGMPPTGKQFEICSLARLALLWNGCLRKAICVTCRHAVFLELCGQLVPEKMLFLIGSLGHLLSAPVLDGVACVGRISEEVERHEPVYFG